MLKFGNVDLGLTPFAPYLNFWTGHSQTILGHIIPSAKINFELQHEILTLPDGDQLLIEYRHGAKPFTLSVYHGLGGDSRADYMRRSALLAHELDWNIVLVNHRAAASEAVASKSYHSGRGEDAEHVINWCRIKFPGTKQVALGFSMSGSILLNLVTKRYGNDQPDYAIVVNAPLDLKKAAWNLARGFCRIYDYRFFWILKKIILQRQKVKLPWIGRTVDIDEAYTAPFNNFKNRDEYYEMCSTRKHLEKIKTKTFILSAKDDPFIDIQDYLNQTWGDFVHLTLNDFGGHMGYYSQTKDPKHGRRWLDHYLESVLRLIQNNSII